MAKLLSKLILIACLLHVGQSAKILGILPIPKSHYILGSALMRELAEKGHDVTVISPVGEKVPPNNGTYRDIVLPGFLEDLENKKMNFFDHENMMPMLSFVFMAPMMVEWNKNLLKHPVVQNLIHSNEKFDVVIIEEFMNDCLKALATHFNAPLIVLSSQGANGWVDPLVSNPSPLSYIPSLGLEYSPYMTLFQKINNYFYRLVEEALKYFYYRPNYNRIVKQYIPNSPDLDDIIYNASIVLLNSHPSFQQPVPHVPNMVEIGGFHVRPPKKLPQDLQKYLDDANQGVIYFSMGTNLKSVDFPPEKREAILEAFAELKQKVVWKWEEEELPGKPDNVKLGKWLPQQSILAHPNVKLFITHGGLLSTIETVYHGVPILAIPIFGDQRSNAQIAVRYGFGLSLPYGKLNKSTLSKYLEDLLNNPKYRNNAKLRSQIFHDRPEKPMDTAIYWVEYVARYGGCSHLRVAGLDLPWYKYHLLDVIAFLFATVLLILWVNYLLIKIVCQSKCRKNATKTKKNK